MTELFGSISLSFKKCPANHRSSSKSDLRLQSSSSSEEAYNHRKTRGAPQDLQGFFMAGNSCTKAIGAFMVRSKCPETWTWYKSRTSHFSQSHCNDPGSRSGSAKASRVSTCKEKNACKFSATKIDLQGVGGRLEFVFLKLTLPDPRTETVPSANRPTETAPGLGGGGGGWGGYSQTSPTVLILNECLLWMPARRQGAKDVFVCMYAFVSVSAFQQKQAERQLPDRIRE